MHTLVFCHQGCSLVLLKSQLLCLLSGFAFFCASRALCVINGSVWLSSSNTFQNKNNIILCHTVCLLNRFGPACEPDTILSLHFFFLLCHQQTGCLTCSEMECHRKCYFYLEFSCIFIGEEKTLKIKVLYPEIGLPRIIINILCLNSPRF